MDEAPPCAGIGDGQRYAHMERAAYGRTAVRGPCHARRRDRPVDMAAACLPTPGSVSCGADDRMSHRRVESEPADSAVEWIDAIGIVRCEDDGPAAAWSAACRPHCSRRSIYAMHVQA